VVLDSSSVVAIHLAESGYRRLASRIEESRLVVIGAPTLAETAIVLSSKLGRDARPQLRAWLRDYGIEVVPFGDVHADAALTAFLRFGKGRHPAALNMGDCMSYAVALVADLPLLCVGEEFVHTDIHLA